MNINENVAEILQALDRAKTLVPKDWEYLSTDNEIVSQVIEMEFMPKPLSDHLGINKELFPSPAHLEDDEIKLIVDKILDTWAVYNYIADLPNGLSIRLAYEKLLSVWDETVPCFPFGNYYFDFYESD